MGSSKVKTTIRSLFASYLLAAVFLVVLAFLLYKFHLKESHVGLAVSAIYVGGLLMGKGIRQRRFFWGFLLGALYFAVLFAASFLLGKGLPMDTGQLLRTFIMCAASGTIGGMLS